MKIEETVEKYAVELVKMMKKLAKVD